MQSRTSTKTAPGQSGKTGREPPVESAVSVRDSPLCRLLWTAMVTAIVASPSALPVSTFPLQMTRRVVAALIAVLLPLEAAVPWAACASVVGESAPVTATAMGPAMPMGESPCQPESAPASGHHDRPCSDSPGNPHGCQTALPCGISLMTVSATSTRHAAAVADVAAWLDQPAPRTRSLRPEPPPPRS